MAAFMPSRERCATSSRIANHVGCHIGGTLLMNIKYRAVHHDNLPNHTANTMTFTYAPTPQSVTHYGMHHRNDIAPASETFSHDEQESIISKNMLGRPILIRHVVSRYIQAYFRSRCYERIVQGFAGKRILDYGAGSCSLSGYLLEQSIAPQDALYAYEPSAPYAAQGRELFPALNISESIKDMPQMDIILLVFVIGYVPDKREFFRSLSRLSRPGTRLLVEVNNQKSLYNKLKKNIDPAWNIDAEEFSEHWVLEKRCMSPVDSFPFDMHRNTPVKNIMKIMLSLGLRLFGNAQHSLYVFRPKSELEG